MENIESVVRERNKAYWLLETDELGERPSTWSNNVLGKFFHTYMGRYAKY